MDPLPIPGRHSYLSATRKEWEAWFTSGAADDWTEAQVAHAARAIRMIDDLNRSDSASERIKIDQAVRQALRVLGLTKRDDEDEGPSEADIAEAKRLRVEEHKVHTRREAIRLSADAPMVRDRGGQVHDTRNILIADSWATDYPDQQLQDERQAQAEADGTWPS
ncbi:MAG: hypothetical protein ACYDHN_01675 [Solirubrobacteraceae bacterium]